MDVHEDAAGDLCCEHGVAVDVHCCGCHSGFLFDIQHCTCLDAEADTEKWQRMEAFCTRCGGTDVRRDREADHPGIGICATCGPCFLDDRPRQAEVCS